MEDNSILFYALWVFRSPALLKKAAAFLILSWLACLPRASLAQQGTIKSFSLGPSLSYTFGTPLDIERAAVSTLGSNGQGTSQAQTFGAGLELSIPTFLFNEIGVSLIGKYSWTIGQFNSNPYSSADNATSAQSTQQFHLSSRYGTASIALFAAYHLSDRWDLGLGGEIGYRVQDSLTDWREILSPAGLTFANGNARDTVAAGSAISSSPFRVAVPVFIGYSIPIVNGISIAGRLFGEADLNEIFAGYAGQSLSAGISFSLLFGKHTAPSNDAAIVTAPTQPPPPPLPPAHILATVHLEIYGVAAKSASIREVDTLMEMFTATAEHVRIPKAESQLVRSYIVPDLSVSRFVESEKGVRRWNVRVTQAGRVLSEYSSADSVEQSAMSASIELGGANRPSPILAEMTVTNAEGATRSVWDTLSLIVDTMHLASHIQKQLYLFLPRTSADLRHQDSLLLRNLLFSLDTSGKLTISPLHSKIKKCPEQDSLSSFILSAIRASYVRPRLIELFDQPAYDELKTDTGECGVLVRYVRGE